MSDDDQKKDSPESEGDPNKKTPVGMGPGEAAEPEMATAFGGEDDVDAPAEGVAASEDDDDAPAPTGPPSRPPPATRGGDDEPSVVVAPDAYEPGGSDHGETAGDEGDEPESRPALYLAEYTSPDALESAAKRVRDAGYEKWDCHTPYPVHGLDDAMGLRPTNIGWISFIAGMTGLVTAVLMIQYMNNWDYPIVVGGKPPGAFPSMVPIMFELTVLLTGFGTLFGMLHLTKLPRHHHPIFESERFLGATDDKFFLSIEVQDEKFDLDKTRSLLESTTPSHLELVEEEID